jgi:Mg-chelatase subunit ChlD
VGTAHSLDLDALARSGAIEFRLGRSGRRVASSRAFLAVPGRPFDAPGGSLRGDFAIYALDAPPRDARTLAPARRALARGARVRVVGVPAGGVRDEQAVTGSVVTVAPDRIEVRLDAPHDLSGWGGAPVLAERTARVVGLLQAQWPGVSRPRLEVAPITGVLEALAQPIAGATAQPFARFASASPPAAPAPSGQRSRTPQPAHPEAPTRIQLDVDYPHPGARVGATVCGLFVAGHALAHAGALPRFDVAFVIDTSGSTQEASGADVDGDGRVAKARLAAIGSLFSERITDAGDSILAAEIAAARQLLRGFDPRRTRVAVVTFAGDPPQATASLLRGRSRPAAVVRQPLTTDTTRVEDTLRAILDEAPAGATDMAAGLDLATTELDGGPGALSEHEPDRERIVLFFTDGRPTLPHPGFEADNVRAVLRAAERSRRGGVRIHSFAIGPEALDAPIAALEMAQRTGGFFTPVRHPSDLQNAVEAVSFTRVRAVALRNATTGNRARALRVSADGGWAGLVPATPGLNRLDIVARSDDGTRVQRQLAVFVEASQAETPVSPDLAPRRNRLLEDCLRDSKRSRKKLELRHAEAIRQELQVEIERERSKASRRAAEQRRELRLEVETAP